MRIWMNQFVLALVVMMVASSAQAQTAVAPTTGSGIATNPYQITELGNLVWLAEQTGSFGKYYRMENNIDASATTNSTWNAGAGFAPIGTNEYFMGTFDGNGKVISGLCVRSPSKNYMGLFGFVGSDGVVKNLGLVGGSIAGSNGVGAMAGYVYGTMSNCYATCAVTGSGESSVDCGGLVGRNNGTVQDSYATGTVIGGGSAGGLVGGNFGLVKSCHATGAATGSNNETGGLVGTNHGTVEDSYATGGVTGVWATGGLVGANYGGGLVNGCYSAGEVTGFNNVMGGLVGENDGGTVSNCYATAATTGGGYSYIGGLVGDNVNGAKVIGCYAAGLVTGNPPLGGLVGSNTATVASSYWDTNTTGQTTSSGGAGAMGRSTAQMKLQATFVGWDFTNVWRISESRTYPLFKWSVSAPTGLPWTNLLLGQ